MERKELAKFFSMLKRQLDRLEPTKNNEAVRHDLLVYPILTKALGWNGSEILAQQSEIVPREVTSSYFWRGAVPVRKRPDLIIVPYGISRPVAVIEEKKRQFTLAHLRRKSQQLAEYQYLYETIWGLITDGEKWILKRNLEVLHEFTSLDDLFRGFSDLHACIARDKVISRILQYGTSDLIVVCPSPHVRVLVSPYRDSFKPQRLVDLLHDTTPESLDFLKHMIDLLSDKEERWERAHGRLDIQSLVRHLWRQHAHSLLLMAELLIRAPESNGPDVDSLRQKYGPDYREHVSKWESLYYWTDRFYEEDDLSEAMVDAVMNLLVYSFRPDTPVLAHTLPLQGLDLVQKHELFRSLPGGEIKAIVQRIREDSEGDVLTKPSSRRRGRRG